MKKKDVIIILVKKKNIIIAIGIYFSIFYGFYCGFTSVDAIIFPYS